jgi:DNA-binding LytR/AlgR family response regulator
MATKKWWHIPLRIHRSVMINPNHVKEYNIEEYCLTMTNGEKVIILRKRKIKIKILFNYGRLCTIFLD